MTPIENTAIICGFFDAEAKEKKLARRIVWLQLLTTVIGAIIAYSIKGVPQTAVAMLSGGLISVANGAMLLWRMSRPALHSAHDELDPRAIHQHLRLLYFYAAERFMVVIALLGLCMAVLNLLPLGLLGGFVVGQATLIVARLLSNK